MVYDMLADVRRFPRYYHSSFENPNFDGDRCVICDRVYINAFADDPRLDPILVPQCKCRRDQERDQFGVETVTYYRDGAVALTYVLDCGTRCL